MKKLFLILVLVSWLFGESMLFSQNEGETLFNQICVACHTIGQGKRIGPDLANVQQRRSEAWLISFIKSSQSVIKSGDAYAVKLFNEYNKMVMPDNGFSDDQIRSILNYIAAKSPAPEKKVKAEKVAPAAPAPVRPPTEADITHGEKLFSGVQHLTNGGPSCISCHTANYKNTFSGGGLARDLTTAFSRLNGAAGIQAILSNPPFPAMKQAYEGKPLTEEEKISITAFLQEVDQNKAAQQAKNYNAQLLFSGLGGAFLLLLLFGGLWTRSKRKSVNQAIYDRQIKSQ